VDRFADDDGANVELAGQAAAIPARGECGDHDLVAVAALPASLAKGVGLAVDGRILLLHAAVVATAEDASLAIGQACPDRDPAFGEPQLGLLEGHLQKLLIIHYSSFRIPPRMGYYRIGLCLVLRAAGFTPAVKTFTAGINL